MNRLPQLPAMGQCMEITTPPVQFDTKIMILVIRIIEYLDWNRPTRKIKSNLLHTEEKPKLNLWQESSPQWFQGTFCVLKRSGLAPLPFCKCWPH